MARGGVGYQEKEEDEERAANRTEATSMAMAKKNKRPVSHELLFPFPTTMSLDGYETEQSFDSTPSG